MELRTELGAEDMTALAVGSSIDALERLLVRWNLLDADGTDAPVDRDHVARLFTENFDAFNKWTAKNVRYSSLPNVSAAPSRTSSRGSGTHTPRLMKVASSTT